MNQMSARLPGAGKGVKKICFASYVYPGALLVHLLQPPPDTIELLSVIGVLPEKPGQIDFFFRVVIFPGDSPFRPDYVSPVHQVTVPGGDPLQLRRFFPEGRFPFQKHLPVFGPGCSHGGVSSPVTRQFAVFQVHAPAAESVEKAPVMRYDDADPRVFSQGILNNPARFPVEVIGRLIHEQYIGTSLQASADLQAFQLSAAEGIEPEQPFEPDPENLLQACSRGVPVVEKFFQPFC